LTDYVIKKGNETPAEGDWQDVPALLGVNRKEYTASLDVTEPGQYYAFFRDEAGNVTVSPECFTVYKYNFAPGAADVTGTMNPVLKEESQTITLPSETYERTGYSFKDWQSTAGIFEDGAKISANPKNGFEDTLTALWAGNQYSYTVNYYLMDLEGEYPAEAYKTKTFYAAYGAEESSDMDALSLDLTGFTRDDTKKEEITVISNDQELNVYYSRNQYKLTRTYTEPGADEATVDVKSFYYEADLTDILSDSQKPKIDGYKFVGWFFGDAGSQPTTMPAMDVAASGYFTNEIVNYHINYYLQDLKADGTAASTYTINKSAAKTLTASYGDAISMDSDLAELPDGFSYASAFVTNEAYTDDTIALPEGAAETVSSTAAEGRTINVFLTRNTYTAKLNVWQGKVNSGNPIYTYSVNLLYGAEFPEDFANKNKDQWVAGDNYRLADYVGWSTESEPETMPAGDVTVTRQYVLKVTGTYKVRIYLETVDDGVYESPREFTFYENVGKNVSVGENESDTIKISDFASGVPYLQYYEFDEENENNKLSGAVTDTNSGEDELVLSVYMNRKVMTSTISYYADNKLIATTTKSAKWGHTYHYDALSLFDVSEGGVWTEGETRGDLTFKGTVEGQNPDAYDFRNNNYVAIYSGHYVMNEKDNWPSKDFNSVASLSQNPEIIMGQSSNTATVRYSHVDPEEMYCLKIGYNSSALSHGQNLFVPLTYVDEEAGLNFTEIYAANEAYFFEDTTYVSDPAFSDYPGLGNYNLNNGKPNETTGRYFYDKDGDLKEGFSRVTINGKTYYQNGSALYIPVTANNLFVGKWTSYAIPTNEVGYQDVTDFLESYKAAWPNDPYAQGAYVYSRGWG
ncbi:MAG: hypothetical protein HUJ78_02255, partial [Mogibacterium sp.]|nr:hypothetical protein [Mogibacterium sp.]